MINDQYLSDPFPWTCVDSAKNLLGIRVLQVALNVNSLQLILIYFQLISAFMAGAGEAAGPAGTRCRHHEDREIGVGKSSGDGKGAEKS